MPQGFLPGFHQHRSSRHLPNSQMQREMTKQKRKLWTRLFPSSRPHTYVTEREGEREERARTTHKHGTKRDQPSNPTHQANRPGGEPGGAKNQQTMHTSTFLRSTGGLGGYEHPGMNPCHGHATRPGLTDVGILRPRGIALSPPSGPWGFVEGLRQVHPRVD